VVAPFGETVTLLGGQVATDRRHVPVARGSVAELACVVARLGHVISVAAGLIPQGGRLVTLLGRIVSLVCGLITPVAGIVPLRRRCTGPRGLLGRRVDAFHHALLKPFFA
jgi:hypothetical protein